MPRAAFVEDLAFTPLCMDADELAGWRAQNDRNRHGNGIRAKRPCEDCLLGFAAEMRAVGRCNGEPGGDGADDQEPEAPEEAMTVTAPVDEAELVILSTAGPANVTAPKRTRLSPEGAARIAAAAKARAERQRQGRVEHLPVEEPNVVPAGLPFLPAGWPVLPPRPQDPLVVAYRVVREMKMDSCSVDELLGVIARRIADQVAGE